MRHDAERCQTSAGPETDRRSPIACLPRTRLAQCVEPAAGHSSGIADASGRIRERAGLYQRRHLAPATNACTPLRSAFRGCRADRRRVGMGCAPVRARHDHHRRAPGRRTQMAGGARLRALRRLAADLVPDRVFFALAVARRTGVRGLGPDGRVGLHPSRTRPATTRIVAQVEPVDNLRGALAGAGLGAILLQIARTLLDMWQKRDARIADQKQQAGKASQDAAYQLRTYLERQIDDLRVQMQRLADKADAGERKVQELQWRESRVNSAFAEFLGVVSTSLPDMPERMQTRMQTALDRLRQMSGFG